MMNKNEPNTNRLMSMTNNSVSYNNATTALNTVLSIIVTGQNVSSSYNVTTATAIYEDSSSYSSDIFNVSSSSSDGDFLIGLTLIEFIITVAGTVLGLALCFYICCIFGKKKPPLDYAEIVGKVD